MELRNRLAQEGVTFDRMFREKVGGDTKKLMKPKRLKHDRNRFDGTVRMKLYTPIGDWTNYKHGSTGFKTVCAIDRYSIQIGEVELQEAAQPGSDRFLEIVSSGQPPLRIVPHEATQGQVGRGGLKVYAHVFHLVLNGNLIGSTLCRSCCTICQVWPFRTKR